MSIGEILNSAKNALFSKYGKTLLSFLAYLLVTYVIAFVAAFVGAFLGIIGMIATYVVLLVPLQFGFIKQFIKLYNGEDVKAFDFLKLGFEKFGMSWRVCGRIILKCIGPIILYIIGCIAKARAFVSAAGSLLPGSLIATSSSAYTISSFLIIVAFIWSIILSFKYMFAYNELAHKEDATTGIEIVIATAEIMEGKKGKLFVLELVVFLIVIAFSLLVMMPVVNSFAIMIYLFILIPFIQYSMIAFYEKARGNDFIISEDVVANTYEENSNNDMDNPIR